MPHALLSSTNSVQSHMLHTQLQPYLRPISARRPYPSTPPPSLLYPTLSRTCTSLPALTPFAPPPPPPPLPPAHRARASGATTATASPTGPSPPPAPGTPPCARSKSPPSRNQATAARLGPPAGASRGPFAAGRAAGPPDAGRSEEIGRRVETEAWCEHTGAGPGGLWRPGRRRACASDESGAGCARGAWRKTNLPQRCRYL
jgi:hypothetical protein